jgi:hypothetical protein
MQKNVKTNGIYHHHDKSQLLHFNNNIVLSTDYVKNSGQGERHSSVQLDCSLCSATIIKSQYVFL